MKFFSLAAIASAVFAGVNGAAVSKPRNELESKQILDVCVFINAPLALDVLGVLTVFGDLDLCLCLSALPLFIETNLVAIAAVGVLGSVDLLADLTALILTGGYAPCIPGGPSARVKRDLTFMDAQCPKGLSLCGVQSSWSRTAWECVDTTRDLESCGGCTVGILGHHASGQDCTAIAEVEDVACNMGACEVFSCRFGFEVSEDRTSCVPAEHGHHHVATLNN